MAFVPDKVRVLRSNRKNELEQKIQDFISNENPEIQSTTLSGQHDLTIIIWYK